MELILITALTVLVFMPTWKFHLIIDDVRRSKELTDGILENVNIIEHFRRRFYGIGTLSINRKFNIYHEHVLSTVIHAINSCLVYLALGSDQVSLMAALLYAFNPINNQTSIWLNGRRYAMAVMFTLSMICLGWAGVVLYPLAMILQPVALFAPLFYGWQGFIPIAVVLLFLYPTLKDRIETRFKIIHSEHIKSFTPKKLIPITKMYGFYMRKMIFPQRTMMCYSNLFYWGMTDEGNRDAYAFNKDFAFGCVAVIGSCLVWALLPSHLQSIWVLMCLATLQWCGFISVTQMAADRYVSVATPFMMFFVSHFAYQFLGSYAVTVLIALGVYYLENLKVSMLMYKNMESFWNYHFFFNPTDPKCREFKATTQIRKRDPMGAWETVKQGLLHNPTDFKLNLLAANCMNLLDDKRAVILYLKQAKKYCYHNQEFILKDAQKGIFGFDIDAEIAKINAKESSLPKAHRENVLKIYETVNA